MNAGNTGVTFLGMSRIEPGAVGQEALTYLFPVLPLLPPPPLQTGLT